MSPPIGTDTVSVDVLATLQPEEESNSDRGFRSKLELAAAAGAMLRDLLVRWFVWMRVPRIVVIGWLGKPMALVEGVAVRTAVDWR